MIAGDLNQSINYHSQDELAILAKTFNKLAHELNTSITALHQEKEVVENRDEQLNQRNAELSSQRDYLANMQDMVGDGFFEWTPESNHLIISPNFAHSLGLRANGHRTTLSWQDIVHKDHMSAFVTNAKEWA